MEILNYKKPLFWFVAVAIAAIVGIAIVTLTDAKNPYKQDPIVVGEYEGAERLYSSFANGNTVDYAIGADKYGVPVFKYPDAAFNQATEDFADGFSYLQKEFHLLPICKIKIVWQDYGVYGWQSSATGDTSEQCMNISSFFDIYENSFMTKEDHFEGTPSDITCQSTETSTLCITDKNSNTIAKWERCVVPELFGKLCEEYTDIAQSDVNDMTPEYTITIAGDLIMEIYVRDEEVIVNHQNNLYICEITVAELEKLMSSNVATSEEITMESIVLKFACDAPSVVLREAENYVYDQYTYWNESYVLNKNANCDDRNFDKLRIDNIEPSLKNFEVAGKVYDVYVLKYCLHSISTDNIWLAGGMKLNEDGWLYPGDEYMIFENTDDGLKCCMTTTTRDFSPASESDEKGHEILILISEYDKTDNFSASIYDMRKDEYRYCNDMICDENPYFVLSRLMLTDEKIPEEYNNCNFTLMMDDEFSGDADTDFSEIILWLKIMTNCDKVFGENHAAEFGWTPMQKTLDINGEIIE